MKLIVLGSGSAFPAINRFNSCYLVDSEDGRFLVDCGSDALKALRSANVDLFSFDNIFITHLHADHCGGLPAILTAMHVLERREPMTVHVPGGQLDFVGSWLSNFFIFNGRMTFEIGILPITEGKIKFGGHVDIEFIRTKHLEKFSGHARKFGIDTSSYSMVVRESSKSLYFSSDLSSVNEARELIPAHSVSLVEATHPSIDELAELTRSSGGGFYFTHIPQELEEGGAWRRELSARFGIEELRMVHDGQVLNI